MQKIDENYKFNEQHLDYAVEVLTEAFMRSLYERIGDLNHKPDTELLAWRQALENVKHEVELFIDTKA